MNTKDNDPEMALLGFFVFRENPSYQVVDNFSLIWIMMAEHVQKTLYGYTQEHIESSLHSIETIRLNTSVFFTWNGKYETRGYVNYHRGGQVDIYAKFIYNTEEGTPSEMIQLCHFEDYTTFWQWVQNPIQVKDEYMDAWKRFCDKHKEEWEKESRERQEEEIIAAQEEESIAPEEKERRKKEAALLAFSQFLEDERKKGTEYVRHISDEDWEATLASLPKTIAQDLGSGWIWHGTAVPCEQGAAFSAMDNQ